MTGTSMLCVWRIADSRKIRDSPHTGWVRRYTIASRWLLYAAVYLGFALASAPWHVWTVFVVYGLFFGLTEGAERALVVDLVPGQWRGRAPGWYQAVVGIGLLPANLMFGVLYQYYGAGNAFTMGAMLALIMVGLLPAHSVFRIYDCPAEDRYRQGSHCDE